MVIASFFFVAKQKKRPGDCVSHRGADAPAALLICPGTQKSPPATDF